MNNTATLNQPLALYKPRGISVILRWLKSPLVITLLISYIVIACAVLAYLHAPEKYLSEYSLVLPTTGSSSKIQLDEVGQVSQSSTSAFGNQAYSPLSNYKQIMLNGSVVQQAANQMQLAEKSFGQPKVQILQQTSILEISIQGSSAEQVNKKAWALYESFQLQLDQLRLDEASRHETSIERMLTTHRDRLNKTRRAIVDFQQRSLLVATSQMDRAIETLANVRDELTFSESEKESQKKFVRRLSNHLGVSPELAGHALSLQSDAEFAAYLTELSSTAAQLSRYRSQWGQNHPKVMAEKQRFNNVVLLLSERSTDVIGVHSAKVLHSMNLGAATELSQLFSQLLGAGAKLDALEAKIDELKLADARLDDQLRVYAREYAELERLEREHQRAEAIYSAAAATLEQGKTDIFSSYPIVQMLGHPSLPGDASSPKKFMAFVFAIASLILVHLGVLIAWQRHQLINRLLKRY